MQVDYVSGLPGRRAVLSASHVVAASGAGLNVYTGVGMNSTTVNSATEVEFKHVVDAVTVHASFRGYPDLGYTNFVWLEGCDANPTLVTATWFGTAGLYFKTGLSGEVIA